MFFYIRYLVIICSISLVHSWDEAELELFDVVEEVKDNFYDVLGVSSDATLSEIKKAYRTLSKTIHPDKSDAPDAEVKFRQLVSVFEVLKDPKMRKLYEKVLVEGLPDWRSPIYYYRRARKMSLVEISIILLIVISITQYLMAWGSYVDKRQTLEQFLFKKYKIKDKRKKKAEDLENVSLMEEELNQLPKPSFWNILPVQLCRFSIFFFRDGPGLVCSILETMREEKRLKEEEEKMKIEKDQMILEEVKRRKEARANLKNRKPVSKLPDYTNENIGRSHERENQNVHSKIYEEEEPVITGGLWTDDDFIELARLISKYPGGTIDRWEKIAESMNRTVYEVTTMSSRVKQMSMIKPATNEESLVYLEKAKPKSAKKAHVLPTPTMRLDEMDEASNDQDESQEQESRTKSNEQVQENITEKESISIAWTPLQQKVLETSLKTFPKGTDQRWDMIARCVPGKSKEDCIARYKFLAEKIQKKKVN